MFYRSAVRSVASFGWVAHSVLVVALGAAAGCAGPQSGAAPAQQASRCSPCAAAGQAADPTQPLGTVNGRPITRADLPLEATEQLRDVENELKQRQLHTLWAGFEDVVQRELLNQEAKRRGISVRELHQQEVSSKVVEATNEEAKAFYDRLGERVGEVPFEAVAPRIKEQLTRQREEELQEAFLSSLRQNVKVEYTLPAPDLPRYPVDVAGAPVKGPGHAPVTIVEFSDFQCPYCAEARHLLERVRQLYPNQVRVAYRDFPLSQHPQARPAAEAAQCAHEQGKFWEYHDLLFEHPQALQPSDLEGYARELALDMEAFNACLSSERPGAKVKMHEADARRHGVEGTPAIFINGIKLIGLLPLPLLRTLIDNEIESAAPQT